MILAVSLNLTVGILGELSHLSHAGFMCVGAFTSAFCQCMVDAIPVGNPYFLALIRRQAPGSSVFDRNPCSAVKGDYRVNDAAFW